MKITATKTEHRGETRFMLLFPYDKETIETIRKIAGASWSQTRKAWHIPFTNEAFSQLKALYPDVECSEMNFPVEPSPAFIYEKVAESFDSKEHSEQPGKVQIDIIFRASGHIRSVASSKYLKQP
jgi:hypothetical protein